MTNILTLQMDAQAQAFFESLRQRHYPAERNQIAAHLTLFHTLPDTPEISAILSQAAAQRTSFPMAVSGLRSLGRGVAYTVVSGDLLTLHTRLSSEFVNHLTPQDKQRFKPHVVVQNKATPELARALLQELERSFHALEVRAVGLELWHYLGGPWKLAETFPFSA